MESHIIGSNLNDFFEFFFIRIFLTFFNRNEVIFAFIQIFEIRVKINLTVLKSGYSSLKLLACLVFRDHWYELLNRRTKVLWSFINYIAFTSVLRDAHFMKLNFFLVYLRNPKELSMASGFAAHHQAHLFLISSWSCKTFFGGNLNFPLNWNNKKRPF